MPELEGVSDSACLNCFVIRILCADIPCSIRTSSRNSFRIRCMGNETMVACIKSADFIFSAGKCDKCVSKVRPKLELKASSNAQLQWQTAGTAASILLAAEQCFVAQNKRMQDAVKEHDVHKAILKMILQTWSE